jgi:hypothetical protein
MSPSSIEAEEEVVVVAEAGDETKTQNSTLLEEARE